MKWSQKIFTKMDLRDERGKFYFISSFGNYIFFLIFFFFNRCKENVFIELRITKHRFEMYILKYSYKLVSLIQNRQIFKLKTNLSRDKNFVSFQFEFSHGVLHHVRLNKWMTTRNASQDEFLTGGLKWKKKKIIEYLNRQFYLVSFVPYPYQIFNAL